MRLTQNTDPLQAPFVGLLPLQSQSQVSSFYDVISEATFSYYKIYLLQRGILNKVVLVFPCGWK